MPPLPSAPPCEHDLRPGTAVCLRCQHAERAAKRARQRQLLARGTVATMVVALVATVGIAAASVLRDRVSFGRSTAPSPRDVAGVTPADSARDLSPAADSAVAGAGRMLAVAVSAASPGEASRREPSPASPPTTPAAPAGISPIVPQGRTTLRDTLVAVRSGDTVRVSFDRELTRTRRPEKFEGIVRRTLPQIYGAVADSALQALPVGALARSGDLLAELPVRGLRIPVGGGQVVAVWPETRPGRDGPLVVAYRAVASR